MTNLSKIISRLERKWLEQLFEFIESLFENQQLSSHDHYHHLRVWHFAKNLLQHVQSEIEINELFVQDLMFASFFHDTGLIRTLDLRHGKESFQILEKHLDNFPGIKLHSTLKEAIVYHDDKSYKASLQKPVYSVPFLLSTADDLDAFGVIGSFRYAEIYLLRGVRITDLGALVQKNLGDRFKNFQLGFNKFHSLIKEQQKRYHETYNVFASASGEFLKILEHLIIDEKYSIYDLMNDHEQANSELRTFTNQLKTEWNRFDMIINNYED